VTKQRIIAGSNTCITMPLFSTQN